MKFRHHTQRGKSLLPACYFWLSLFLITACGTATTTQQRSTPPTLLPAIMGHYTTTEQSNIAYGSLPAEKLDLCQPQGASRARPGVLLLHGGEWTQGDKKEMAKLCTYLAEHGYVVANANYRLAQKSVQSSQWPAQLVDAQLAVRWLRAQSQKLNLAPQHICALGASSGGQLAAFLGDLKTIHAGDQSSQLTDQETDVSCVVDDFGPMDLTGHQVPALTQSMLVLFGGTTLQKDSAPYRDASPLLFVTKESAPTLIVQGDNDTIVPSIESTSYQQELQSDNVSALYITYKGGHNFSHLTTAQQTLIQQQELSYLVAQERP